MKTIDSFIGGFLKFVMAFSSLILSVVTFIQVITRFIYKDPIAWGQDVIRLSFIYLVFWGGAYCIKEKEHLNIDILLTSMGIKTRKIMEIVINLILAIFFIFIVYYGFIFMQSGASQKAPYLPIPMSLYYLALPSSVLLMLYYQIQIIFQQIKNFNKISNEVEVQI